MNTVVYFVQWFSDDNGKRRTKMFEDDRKAIAYARKNAFRKPTVVKVTHEVIVSWGTLTERYPILDNIRRLL